jgi:hypothetical protein
VTKICPALTSSPSLINALKVSKQWRDVKYYTGDVMVDEMAADASKTIDWLIKQIESKNNPID